MNIWRLEPAMGTDPNLTMMRERLENLLEKADISMRAASQKAGLTPGYLYSILKEGREPTVANLTKICQANNFSLAYLLFGFEISPATEKLIELIESSPERRDAVLALLDTQKLDE